MSKGERPCSQGSKSNASMEKLKAAIESADQYPFFSALFSHIDPANVGAAGGSGAKGGAAGGSGAKGGAAGGSGSKGGAAGGSGAKGGAAGGSGAKGGAAGGSGGKGRAGRASGKIAKKKPLLKLSSKPMIKPHNHPASFQPTNITDEILKEAAAAKSKRTLAAAKETVLNSVCNALSCTDEQLVHFAGVPAPSPNFEEALEFKECWIARGKRDLNVLAMCHQPYSQNLDLDNVKQFLRSCQAEHFDDALRVGAFKMRMSEEDLYNALKDQGGDP